MGESIAEKSFGCDVDPSWNFIFAAESRRPYWSKLVSFVTSARKNSTVFPPPERMFSTLKFTPFEDVRVVILGQDPYINPNQANGLAFSVFRHVKPLPPSLRNILTEVWSDCAFPEPMPGHGSLEYWAEQGVLMLNTVLTVESGKSNSHAKHGWEDFTAAIINALNVRRKGLFFLLWGAPAQARGKGIDRGLHHVLEAPHPSPLSAHRGFMGCKHFTKVNEQLEKLGHSRIDWRLDPGAGGSSLSSGSAKKISKMEESCIATVSSSSGSSSSSSAAAASSNSSMSAAPFSSTGEEEEVTVVDE